MSCSQTAVDVLGLAPRPFPVFFLPRFLQPRLPFPLADAPFPGLGVDIFEVLGLNPSDILGEDTTPGGVLPAVVVVVAVVVSPVVKSGSSKLLMSDHWFEKSLGSLVMLGCCCLVWDFGRMGVE